MCTKRFTQKCFFIRIFIRTGGNRTDCPQKTKLLDALNSVYAGEENPEEKLLRKKNKEYFGSQIAESNDDDQTG